MIEISLPKVNICDLLEFHKEVEVKHKMLVNIRGCNGSGKSTIPMMMLATDEYAFEVYYYNKDKKNKKVVIGTVFPSYNFIAMGHYKRKCGGMDTIENTDTVKKYTKIFWNLDYNILMEGIMASTVRQTYIDLFQGLNNTNTLKREIIIYNIVPPIGVCLKRIQDRNGGKAIKEDLVFSKWKTVNNNVKHFEDAGFKSLRVSNDTIPKSETLRWFFNKINSDDIEAIINLPSEDTEHYVEPKEQLTEYEWFPWYKEPSTEVKFNQEYLDGFWKFIYDRLEIYHKRVVLKQDAPWSNDEVFNTYKFTNISRDMDKLTIYERKHILSKLDEPVNDLELRKKSVMFNVILFRIFVKIDTYECFGFIDFSDKNWKSQWKIGKEKVLLRREQGEKNFTGSFMVNTLKPCNPDESTRDNQSMNALCMCEYFIDNLDDVYSKAILKPKNMKEQLEYLTTLNGVGGFTAYELACSFAMVGRYFNNTLVDWSQDSYTNIGPGSNGGLEWVYQSFGNLSKVEAIIYLRSIWKHEMKRLNLYDRFISMLPKFMENELDLRVIEHCLCENHKYNKLKTKTGRTKKRFTPETSDVTQLEV